MQQIISLPTILDDLTQALDAARPLAGPWASALETAYDWLLQQDVLCYDPADHSLLVASANLPGGFRRANGTCDCTAFRRGKPCRHRAAARLVRRAWERWRARQGAVLGRRLAQARRAALV